MSLTTYLYFVGENMYACDNYKVSLWKSQEFALAGLKKSRFLYKLRIHLRPNENDLPAVKLTYLQVFFHGDCRTVIRDRVQMYNACATALDGAG